MSDDLIRAALEGDIERMAQLLDDGADIDGNGQSLWSALHSAIEHGRIDAVRLLVRRGLTSIVLEVACLHLPTPSTSPSMEPGKRPVRSEQSRRILSTCCSTLALTPSQAWKWLGNMRLGKLSISSPGAGQCDAAAVG
jgi:hypothetical protein